MSNIGVSSFADVGSQVAGLITETTGFTAASTAATTAAAVVTPPGNDLDSAAASAQQVTTTANFIGSLGSGIAQLGGRAAETGVINTTFEGLSAAGAAAVSMV